MPKYGYYLRILRRFFALGATSNKNLTHLVTSSLMRVLAYLLVPFTASMIISSLETGDQTQTFVNIGLFFASAVFYLLCNHYNYWSYYKNANDTHNNLQHQILKKVTEFDAGFTANIPKATLISTAFQDVDQARQVPDFFCDTATNAVGIIASNVVLCFVDLKIGLIVAGLLLISVLIFVHHTKKRDYYRFIQREHADELAGLYGQMIDGYKEVQTLNLGDELSPYQERENDALSKYHALQRHHRDFAAGMVPFIIGVGRIIIYLISAGLILKGEYTVAALVLVLGYYENILFRYDKICACIDNVSRSSVAVERLHRLLNYKTPHMLQFGNYNQDDIKGAVEFKNVSFVYDAPPDKMPDGSIIETPRKKMPSFKNISFKINPCSFTTIVGKSGSGKSTLFRLLLRFYRVQKGEILLDGKSIYDYSEDVYATNVSIVTQKPFIFDMTIRENLNLVDSDHTHQIAACKLAGIHNDIMKLEKGYDTVLSRDAENLSIGQKQLLSLARTLLSKSEVLLFDEVTASLDSATTEKVMLVLKKLKETHTVIMITHRPELMRVSDRILVIDKGRVVGDGTHRQLLKNSPHYRALQK